MRSMKPKLQKRINPVTVAFATLRRPNLTTHAISDALRTLFDDDPSHLDAELLFGLCRGFPEHAAIICMFTHPLLRKQFAQSTYIQKQPNLRRAFIEGPNSIKFVEPKKKKSEKLQLFRK